MAHRKSLDESRTAGLRHKRGHGGGFGGLSEFVGSKRHMLFIWFVANVFDGNHTAFKTKNGDVGYFGWLLRGLLEWYDSDRSTDEEESSDLNLEEIEIFIKTGKEEKGFLTVYRGTLGNFLYIEPSYAASPLNYVNS